MVHLHRLCLLLLPIYFRMLCAQTDDDRNGTFIFNELNGQNLILLKDASIRFSKVLSLTRSSSDRFGRALYSNPIQMKSHGSIDTVSSFSTTFVFSIPPGSTIPGHGLAFIVTPHNTSMGEFAAGYLGMLNFWTNRQPSNHLFAVEFDTVRNLELGDINDNHVGVDLNSLISVESMPAGYWITPEKFSTLDLNTGDNIQAWIDYDHMEKELNVTIALAGFPEPIRPLISIKSFDLSDIFRDQMYVGFCAAIGELYVEGHYVQAWSFTTNGKAPALDLSHLRDFKHGKPTDKTPGFIAGITVTCFLLLSIAVCAACCWSRRNRGEIIEGWELDLWPHKFSYKELSIATKGFQDEGLLGSGGFGKVYRGIIPSSGAEVAVKCISKEINEGMKEFVSEISSMGRLQHRNLVPLRGWCRMNNQLFIVYDYMANGSLDNMIFGERKASLRWPQRYKIIKGVASGLLYLHEEWEKKIVHRDIKSSNVLLDSNLNPRLGDFGLARLYDHSENPRTTHIVGTLGYIAPELIHTGRATTSSDVFSFGVLMLEVACGRSPIDQSRSPGQQVLVDWMWDLHQKENLLDAADPKLGGDFNVGEMLRVLHLGLLCAHPEPEVRPTIREALGILAEEVPIPCLPVPLLKVSIMSYTSRSYFPVAYATSSASLKYDDESSKSSSKLAVESIA